MADLKPCPFCDHSAALESVGADHFVMCDGCCAETARFQSPAGDNQRAIEHAIDAWNRRAASPTDRVGDARDAEKYRSIIAAVVHELGREDGPYDGNAPGHAHDVPGIWDSGNGAKAGKPCAWCKTWNLARAAIAAKEPK